jgi:hypothetical protein
VSIWPDTASVTRLSFIMKYNVYLMYNMDTERNM